MKRKLATGSASVVPQELLDRAKSSFEADRLRRTAKCTICGSESAPISSEDLCWVCRRLKISAWHDNDTQMSA
ncbi:MAG: hypothetical protein HY822_03695 [Acidobacteria bacterium]|nr:hypothetical protein [Acidobacteriota bacterium]